jgi:predicted Zn-dependent peptidase
VLIVAGRFDPDATLGLIAKYFGRSKPAHVAAFLHPGTAQDGERQDIAPRR